MNLSGNLHKMHTHLSEEVIYSLNFKNERIVLNELLGKPISIEFTGEIYCIKCGRKTNKSFSQGFCYPCFRTAPETEECVIRPELCKAHEGIARDMEYAKNHCLIDHFVYLSLTSGVKVGVTRNTQIPTRWIDQGAIQAIKLAQTPNRYTAGLIEIALKQYLPDKTNWRNMLTGKKITEINLNVIKQNTVSLLNEKLSSFLTSDNKITHIHYPLPEIPLKVVSLNFDKTPLIKGILTGIKGQYLIFDNRAVLNVRKFGGYQVNLSC